jgi:hypothetical protein
LYLTGATGCVQSSGARTYAAGGNYTYNAATDGITGAGLAGAATLTIATTAGARITLSKPVANNVPITTAVNLVSGILLLDLADLILNSVGATFTGSPWTTSNMVANENVTGRYGGTGRVMKLFQSGTYTLPGAFTFPLGDVTGTVEYTPVIITTLSYNTAASTPYIAVKVKDAQHPSDANLTNYLSRHWQLTSNFYSATINNLDMNYAYTAADLAGTASNEALIKLHKIAIAASSLLWTEDAGSSAAANVLTASTITNAADINDDDVAGRVNENIYFRSVASTNFELPSTWIVSTDVNFVAPAGVVSNAPPTYSNSEGIRIMNTHNVTLGTGNLASIDQMTIDAGGTLTLGAGTAFTVNDGAGTDLTVDGTLYNGNLAGVNTFVGTTQFNATGLYNHAFTGGLIPTATWIAGSECRITGPMASAPSGLGQAFSDFTWNTSTQTISLNLSSGLTNVGRDLNIVNTNSFTLGLTATTALALTVGRDLNVSGGLLTLVTGANASAVSMAVTNDINISGSGSFSVAGTGSSGAGTVGLTVGGTFNNSSTLAGSFILNGNNKTTVTADVTGLYTQSGSGTSSLHITTGTGAATLNCNGGLTISAGTINVANGGPATLNVGAGTNLTLSGGTLIGSATAHTSTINANGTVNVNTGNLTIATLGTGNFNVADAYDFNLNGGTVDIATGGTGNLNIGSTSSASNIFNLNGGTLNVASGGTGNLNLYNDLDLAAGNINRSAGTATVHFRGIGVSLASVHTQNFTQSAATITGAINFTNTFGSFTSVVFGSNIDLGAAATLTANSNNSFFDFANFVLTGNAFVHKLQLPI